MTTIINSEYDKRVMTSPFEGYFQKLHLDINENLGSLHLLHHKQQIFNIQLIATQILYRLDGEKDLQETINMLISQIQGGLASDNLGEIIHHLFQFSEQRENNGKNEAIEDLMTHIRMYLKLITKESTNFKDHIQFNDLSQLDTVKAYKEIIDPLSNQKRVDILMAIHNTKKRFKDLEEELNLQAGHLIYHLNPLKEANYVTQDSQKNYILSEKGKTILEAVKHIYDNYLDDR